MAKQNELHIISGTKCIIQGNTYVVQGYWNELNTHSVGADLYAFTDVQNGTIVYKTRSQFIQLYISGAIQTFN